MLNYSAAFLAELEKRIRNPAHCSITMLWDSPSRTVAVDEHLIKNVKISDEVDPLCRTIPTHTCEVSLLDFSGEFFPGNPESIFFSFKPFTLYIQFQIENDAGEKLAGIRYQYFVYELPKWNNYVVTFKGTRQRAFLSEEFYEYTADDEKDAEAISSSIAKGYLWDISGYFASATIPRGVVMPTTSRINCLQLIGASLGTTLMIDSNCSIAFRQYDDQDYPVSVQQRDMFSKPSMDFNMIPTLSNEIIRLYDGSPFSSEAVELAKIQRKYSSTDQVTEAIDLKAISGGGNGIQVECQNATLISHAVYARKAIVTFHPTSTTSEVTVTIKGISITQTAATQSYLVDTNGEEDETFDNTLSGSDTVGHVAYYRSNYLKNLSHGYTVGYRGNPAIEPLDTISVELPFIGEKKCLVTKTVFSYNGAFSGELYVKRNDALNSTTAIAGIAIAGLAIVGTQ